MNSNQGNHILESMVLVDIPRIAILKCLFTFLHHQLQYGEVSLEFLLFSRVDNFRTKYRTLRVRRS